MLNLVEAIATEDKVHWNQPCVYGCLIEGHSVYCHNETWPNAPRKCRRSWYTGGEVRDEDCEGYEQNPDYSRLDEE